MALPSDERLLELTEMVLRGEPVPPGEVADLLAALLVCRATIKKLEADLEGAMAEVRSMREGYEAFARKAKEIEADLRRGPLDYRHDSENWPLK